jgi:hypothetical protein
VKELRVFAPSRETRLHPNEKNSSREAAKTRRNSEKAKMSILSFVSSVRQAKTGFSIDLKCDQHVK